MMTRVMDALKKNWFIIGVLGAIVLGYVFPEAGTLLNAGGIVRNLVVAVIFVMTGYTLVTETILKGLADYRLHLYIQGCIFVVAPLYVIVTTRFFPNAFTEEILIGLFAVSVLPTTITTSNVFTQLAGGNVTGTMFNSAFSNAIGIFLSPFLLSLLLQTTGKAIPAEELVAILVQLATLMFIPVTVGQIARRVFRPPGPAARKKISIFTSVLVLFIVFFSLSSAALQPGFEEHLHSMVPAVFFLIVMHIALVALSSGGAALLGFSRENRISVLFAAPQKTLAMGAPLLTLYFASSPAILAGAILPLIFYHMFQLVVGAFLHGRLSRPTAV